MISSTELLKIAQKHLGEGGAKFRKFCGLPSGAAWCNAYVDYIANEGGVSSLYFNGKKETYCPASIKWCEKNLALVPPFMAMPMDIIYFDWEKNGIPNHIGFVRGKKSTTEIYTIEGNTDGGKVAQKTRSIKYVQGIYRPHLAPSGMKKCMVPIDGLFSYQDIYNLQFALKMSFHDGIMGKATVKALQTKAGLKGKAVDGAWGPATSRAIQSKLLGFKGKDLDGEFGPASVRSLEAWVNKQNGATPITPVPAPTKKTYDGAFPDLVKHSGQKIAYTAKALAWPKGTSKSKYTYPKGKAIEAFTNAINKVYPKRSTWSKQCQAGASCDVGAGTVIRYSGFDPHIPRGLEEQIPYLAKSNRFKLTALKKTSDMIAGDVGVYTGKVKGAHIWIGLGGGLIAEANHTAKYFEHIGTDNYTSSGKKVWGIYRACVPSAIIKGDKGTEVTKLQKFLNWFGNYKLDPDGICGYKTEAAIIDFQKRKGITADGAFGSASLAMAKKSFQCASGKTPHKVVDVSYWQHRIDWARASKDVDGVIARASYTAQASFSLSDDSTFKENVNGAYAHGLKVGAYHYSQAISVEEAKKEAEYLCKRISPYKGKISLPVVCDWEFGGRLSASKAKSLGKAKCTAIVSAFCDVVTGYGYTPMVYANYNTFSNYLDYQTLKKKYMIWLAQYASKPSLDYDYWQYTSSGTVSGINGKVDLNKVK